MKKKKSKVEAFKDQSFVIPQLNTSYEGLKTSKDSFKKSAAVSPFFGRNVKDLLYSKESKEKPDVSTYDIFRHKGEKRISDQELLKKYGTKYPEFKGLSKDKRAEVLGVADYNEKQSKVRERFLEKFNEPVKKPEVKFNFDEPKDVQVPNFIKQDIALEDDIIFKEETPKPEKPFSKYDSSKFSSNYDLPPLDLFETSSDSDIAAPLWLKEKEDTINKTLADFNIQGKVVDYVVGPVFTRYEITLEPGIKVSKVSSLYENFQMNLGVKTIRILAPIPGKNRVGIEVPNDKTRPVLFGDLVTREYQYNDQHLQVLFGQDIEGNTIYRNIEDMPHGLIAGATKSGKSVCINTLLISLLLKNRPEDLRLILIDPKKVELSFYDDLPHLITPVITDSKIASKALEWAVTEMEERYDLLKRAYSRNIQGYNQKAERSDNNFEKLPYILIVIDELADLMMTCPQDVEVSITRITQKARAAGIHLIVATQRPTVQVISGNIKANIPSRIAFKVASQTDSVTILDESGADNLLGKGDMLIKDGEVAERVQGSLIEDDEINAVCQYIRERNETNYLFLHEDLIVEEVKEEQKEQAESEATIYEVAKFCILNNTGSINEIQRKFSFGFNKAQKIMLILENRRVLGPKMGGNKMREVIMTLDELNQIFGKS